MGTLPTADVAVVQQWCRSKVPDHLLDQLRIEVDVADRHLTVVECRPPWREDLGPEWTRHAVARLRYSKVAGTWALYWRDSHERFHEYDRIRPTPKIARLLAEIDRDPTALFWG